MDRLLAQGSHDLTNIGRGQSMVSNFASVVADAQTDPLPAIPAGISGLQRDRLGQRMRGTVEEREGALKWRKDNLLSQPAFTGAAHAVNMLLMPGMAGRALDMVKSTVKPAVAPLADGVSSLLSGLPKLIQVLLTLAAARQQQEGQTANAALPPAYHNQGGGAPFWLGPASS